ncbi:MAG: 4-coumarate--CoA ligase [Pseudomonadota bacterium]
MLHEAISISGTDQTDVETVSDQQRAVCRDGVLACLRDLIHASLSEGGVERTVLTHALYRSGSASMLADTRIGERGLDLDSLDRMSAASAVSRFFDLGTSGVDDYLMHAETLAEWADLIGHHFSAVGGEAKIVFMTSGSVGQPKACTHLLRALAEEVTATAPVVCDPPPHRIVSLVPAHHMYGFLWSVLLGSRTGCDVINAARWPATVLERRLQPDDVIVATPSMWQALVDHQIVLPPGARGLSSGAPMPAQLWEMLDDSGLTSLTEIFGSTETAGLGWRKQAGDPFALMPHLERDGDTIRFPRRHAPLVLQDELVWMDERAFRLAGRKDHAIQIAGVNVSLDHVRTTVLASPLVEAAAIREESGRLKAFIVPQTEIELLDEAAFVAELSAWLRGQLAAPARPVSFTLGAELPRNSMGKITDWSTAP